MATLPIFRLSRVRHDRERVARLAKERFGVEVFSDENGDLEFSDPERRRVLRVRRADGALSYRNENLLWRADAPALDSGTEMLAFDFSSFLSGWGTTPVSTPIMPIALETLDAGYSTITSFESRDENTRHAESKTKQIDRIWCLQVSVQVTDPATGQPCAAPLVGQSGGFRVGIAAENTLTSFWACWWPAESIESTPEVEWPPRTYPGEPSRAYATIESLPAKLVYMDVEDPRGITLLCPMWVCGALEHFDGETREMTPLLFAATKGPKNPLRTQPLRETSDTSGDRTLPHRFGLVGQTISAGTSYASPVLDNLAALRRRLEAGGWNFSFEWLDRNAWHSDWLGEDDLWVDSVDFLYYQGDARPEGWKLYRSSLPSEAQPRTQWLDQSDIPSSTKPDVLGDTRLRWLVIDACGPLQHKRTSNPIESVYYRWKPMFDGLRLLLGMASTVTARAGLGETFLKLMTARRALPLVDAWLEANVQHRGTGAGLVRVGALYAEHNGADTRDDRFPDAHASAKVPVAFKASYLKLIHTSIR